MEEKVLSIGASSTSNIVHLLILTDITKQCFSVCLSVFVSYAVPGLTFVCDLVGQHGWFIDLFQSSSGGIMWMAQYFIRLCMNSATHCFCNVILGHTETTKHN